MNDSNIEYLWCSSHGSYYIPCRILDIRGDKYFIEYVDEILDEKVTRLVNKEYINLGN